MAHTNVAVSLSPLLCRRCGQPIQRSDNVTTFLKGIPWVHVDAATDCPIAEPPPFVPKKKEEARRG